MKKLIGYKFVSDSLRSKNGSAEWVIGEWKKHEGEISLCNAGFHACESPLDSLDFNYGNRWFIVEAQGKILKDADKFVSSEMRLKVEIGNPKIILVEFAFCCANRSLKFFENVFPEDKRPREAIEAADRYLKEPSEKNRSAAWFAAESARSAARSAVESAVWSARSAAESARFAAWSAAESARSAAWFAAESAWSARSAAESAAWSARSAAESAAWSARSAAESAERRWQEKTLRKLIKKNLGHQKNDK